MLAFVAQRAVEVYGWLAPGEMVRGLALAETTPGPLIMVVQFGAFLGAFRDPAPLDPWASAVLGALLTTWVTFVPCFLFIFLGAPYVERLRGNRAVSAALTGITAAVVGVIANLAVYFALQTVFTRTRRLDAGPVHLQLPQWVRWRRCSCSSRWPRWSWCSGCAGRCCARSACARSLACSPRWQSPRCSDQRISPGRKARALRDARLTQVTVSRDSLDGATFRAVSDVKLPVARVVEGIAAAADAGLTPGLGCPPRASCTLASSPTWDTTFARCCAAAPATSSTRRSGASGRFGPSATRPSGRPRRSGWRRWR